MPKVNITIHNTVIQTCELAAILGKTTSWIRHLTRDGVFEQVERGKYVLAEAVQAYNKHTRRESYEIGKRETLVAKKPEHSG